MRRVFSAEHPASITSVVHLVGTKGTLEPSAAQSSVSSLMGGTLGASIFANLTTMAPQPYGFGQGRMPPCADAHVL